METETTLRWWQRKALWTGLLTSISAILTAAGVAPPFITEVFIDYIATGFLAILTAIFGVKEMKPTAPATTTETQ